MRLKSFGALLAAVLLLPVPVLARGGGGHSSGGRSGVEHPSGAGSLGGTGSNPSSHLDRGYTTQEGTRVAPHYQTDPNATMRDNYGTQGNVNPHNGAVGTRTVPY